MALTKAGQVEWDGHVIDPYGYWASGLWMTNDTDLSGWTPLWAGAHVDGANGTVVGPSRPVATEPTLAGVAAESADLLLALEASMAPTVVPRDLAWWDRARGLKLTARVVPTLCEPSTAPGVQRLRHRLVDLRWRFVDKHLYGYDLTAPVEVSASNPTVTHPGKKVSPWTLQVTGPCLHPRVRLIGTTSLVWRWDDLDLEEGQTLTVDSRARTAVVTETGQPSLSVWGRRSGDGGAVPMDWGVAPGAGSQVGFASDGGASTASFRVRPAW